MNDPPSQPSVSVEETENGYIVRAGSAVARISKTGLGYAVDADSQVLKEEYNLSPGVARTRKSIRDVMQFSNDPADNTLLILRTSCPFFLLSQAVEMVCGFLPENFPEENEWMLLSSWKSERQTLAEPEIVDETDVADEKLETTLSDIVSKVEDEVDAEFQSRSWIVKPGISATKILDKSAFERGETGIPKNVCPFFGADKLPAGGKIPILLINNSRMFSGYILKDSHTSERVKMRWNNDFTCVLLEQQSHDSTELHLEFVITEIKDKYETSISRISGSTEIEKKPIPQTVSPKPTKSENINNPNISQHHVVDLKKKEEEKTDIKDEPEPTDCSSHEGMVEWKWNPGISATLKLENAIFDKTEIVIPEVIASFFASKTLSIGESKAIHIKYNSKKYHGFVIKDVVHPKYAKLFIDTRFEKPLSEFCATRKADGGIRFTLALDKKSYDVEFGTLKSLIEDDERMGRLHTIISPPLHPNKKTPVKSDKNPVPKKTPVKSKMEMVQPIQTQNVDIAKDSTPKVSVNLQDVVNGVNVPFDSDKKMPMFLSYDKDVFPPTIVDIIHNDWSISSDKKTVVRHINPDHPLHTGTPIPTELSNYFDVISVPYKQSIVTTLIYNSEKYDATIHRMSKQIEDSGLAARLVWGDRIQTALEKYYKKHPFSQNIVFRKIDDVYEYELSFTSKFFCDDWEFSQKNPGVSLSDLVSTLKSIIYDKTALSIHNYLLILALIRFCSENLDWENDAKNTDEQYVYVPFSDIFKKWLEYLSPFVYLSSDIYLDREEVTNKNFIPFRQDLHYILDYYMKLQGTVSFLSDLSTDSVPRGLNTNVLNLLKSAGPMFCREILRPFGKQQTGGINIISVDKTTEESGAFDLINHSHIKQESNRLAIRKDWYYLFNSNIGISIINSGLLGSRIYNHLTSLNPDNKRDIYNILYHLSLIKSEDVPNPSNYSKIYNSEKTTDDSSDSGLSYEEKASFSDKSYIPILRHQLILFGLEKQEATIYALLLFYSDNELMKAQLQPSRLKPEMFDSGIYLLRKRNYILLFNEKNVNNRPVTYYQKDLSPEAVYNDLVKESDKVITNMVKMSEKISILLKLKPYSESPSLVEYLTNIGIEDRDARILVRLNSTPSSVDDLAVALGSTVNAKRIPYSIRKLYSNGWIGKTNEKHNKVLRYRLNDKLDVLVSKYVHEKGKEIRSNLEEFKKFIEFRSQNPKYISEDYINDSTTDYDTTTKKESSIPPSFAEYNEKFLEAINEAVVSHSSVNNKPMEVELCPPYPRKIRVYIFNVIEAKKDDKTEIKVLLRLPGQIDKAKLNFTDTSLVLLCGYYQKEELFVLWDATLHPEFANSTSLHVEKKKLWDAEIYGIATYERDLKKKGMETVMLCTKEKLLETIELRYKKHLDHLLD